MAEFAQAILDRTGLTVEPVWADAKAAELMVSVRQCAPSKRTTWLTFDDLPGDVKVIVLAALARIAENPRGYRQEAIGEYSYTIGGLVMGDSGVFTVPEESTIAREAGDRTSLYSVGLNGSPEMPACTPDVDWNFPYVGTIE